MADIERWPERTERLIALAQARQQDQWHRKDTLNALHLESTVFGFPLHVWTNRAAILQACEVALERFTVGPDRSGEAAIEVRLFVRDPDRDPPAAVLDNHADARGHFEYDAYEDLAAIDFGAHGHCAIDLKNRRAIGFVSDALSKRIEIVARFVISTTLLNILTRCDLIQWHAASLVKGPKTVMLVGIDNSGKSTTALTLMGGGYQIVGESITFTRRRGERFELLGYPVGHLRLRPDGMAFFPKWQGSGILRSSDDGEKWLLDLNKIMPGQVLRDSRIVPNLHVLFVGIGGGERTSLRKVPVAEAMERALPACSLWEGPQYMSCLIEELQRTLAALPCHVMLVGRNQPGTVQAVDRLLEEP
jgi:hypothetical protein